MGPAVITARVHWHAKSLKLSGQTSKVQGSLVELLGTLAIEVHASCGLRNPLSTPLLGLWWWCWWVQEGWAELVSDWQALRLPPPNSAKPTSSCRICSTSAMVFCCREDLSIMHSAVSTKERTLTSWPSRGALEGWAPGPYLAAHEVLPAYAG